MSVVPACFYMYHVHSWSPQRPEEGHTQLLSAMDTQAGKWRSVIDTQNPLRLPCLTKKFSFQEFFVKQTNKNQTGQEKWTEVMNVQGNITF